MSSDRGSSSAQGIQINNIGRTSIILLACFAGLAVGISLGAVTIMLLSSRSIVDKMRDSETETRMLEYYVMELDGKLMKQGVIDPQESWSAKKSKEKR